MRKIVILSVVGMSAAIAMSYAVPAAGGPQAFSSASPVKLAKKALKTARKADRRSKQALAKVSKTGGFIGGNIQTVTSAPVTVGVGAIGSGAAGCPAGTVLISGGFSLAGSEASIFFDHRQGNGWAAGVDNTAAAGAPVPTAATFTVEAQCASTANAVLASRSARTDRKRDRQLVERQRALHRR
jgi:hypothetical protein